jgi:hypothetical protein
MCTQVELQRSDDLREICAAGHTGWGRSALAATLASSLRTANLWPRVPITNAR